MSRPWLVAGAIAVVGVVAAGLLGGWWLFLRDVAEPATVGDAVTAFRQAGSGATRSIPAGVYVYATDGFERTDALGGVTHRYPATSSITVGSTPCGVRLRWDVLRGRSTTWAVCTGAGEWAEQSRYERHTFFGVTDETTYTCRETAFRLAGDHAGDTFAVSCSTGKAEEHGSGRVVADETVVVAGTRVPTAHIRTSTTFTGDTTGAATYDFWLARDTGLPVRIRMVSDTTSGSLIGDVHYRERVSLDLTSLTPRR
jgi:hypothetical protein